jgi:methylated-DNA-[protein]-cysteine S-methyltransferase
MTFDTPIGRCAITWSDAGITGVRLPPNAPDTSGPAPDEVRDAVGLLQAHLAGGDGDLTSIRLDLSDVSAFDRDVYTAARTVPAGSTTTYGALARLAGHPGEGRAVGRAMARNPCPLVVPCHRVLGAVGRLVGFSAPGGTALKSRLLVLEGAAIA